MRFGAIKNSIESHCHILPPGFCIEAKYNEIAAIIDSYCAAHLDDEYLMVCFQALRELCRKQPSLLLSASSEAWASGIVYAIGKNNGMDVPVDQSRAKKVRKALKIEPSKMEWALCRKRA